MGVVGVRSFPPELHGKSGRRVVPKGPFGIEEGGGDGV